jgi:hypothetical protein
MKIIITESQYNVIINEGFDFDSIYKSLYPKMYKQVCLRYANGDKELYMNSLSSQGEALGFTAPLREARRGTFR